MKEYSRRNFLKSSLIAGVGLGALGATGALTSCAPNKAGGSSTASAAVSADNVSWDKETEIVIIGFGAAGSAAALEAAKAGAEVVLMEMDSTGGGSTVLNGGYIYLGGTALQEKLGIKDTTEEMFKYLNAAAGEFGSEDAIRLLCDSSPEICDWCTEIGIEFSGELSEAHLYVGEEGIGLAYSGNERARDFRDIAIPAPRGHIAGPEGDGKSFFRPLKAAVEASGAEIMYESPAEQLVVNETGRVIGVQASVGGKTHYIKASKAVILAGGGFTSNQEMVETNMCYTVRAGRPVANPNEMGTCIKMGQQVGADLHGMPTTQFGNFVYKFTEDACKGILVNTNGRRIIAEDEYGSFIGEKIMQSGGDCFLIIDDTLPGVVEAAEAIHFASAGTLEELAGVMGVNGDILQSTVDLYNSFSTTGVDTEFGKESQFIAPLAKGPFHAFSFKPSDCYYMTQGGLKVNLDSQVINVQGDVIPGLYAAGRASNITYGHYMASGTSMLDCFVFGRIAGQKAAAESAG